VRVFRCGRCDFLADPESEVPEFEQLAEHTNGSGHPLCSVCQVSLEPSDVMVCEGCVTSAQGLLSGVRTMYFEDLPRALGQLRGSGFSGGRPGASDGRPLLGGDVLVLLGSGSEGLAEDEFTTKDGDPASVAFDLGFWEESWREHFGEMAPRLHRPDKMVARAAGYLERRNRQAARSHLGFPDYLDDLHLLHARMERVTGRAKKPLKANASCFDCGRPLVKRDDEERGVEEFFTCVGCHRRYDDVGYALALKQELFRQSSFELDGLTFATRELVAARVDRSKHTIRQWMSEQVVRTHVKGGVRFVCLEDALAQDELRQRRVRSSA
jgi:hypothetical protein